MFLMAVTLSRHDKNRLPYFIETKFPNLACWKPKTVVFFYTNLLQVDFSEKKIIQILTLQQVKI